MAMKYRGPFLVGFAIPLAIIIPISIMSYYNEVENGCIFLVSRGIKMPSRSARLWCSSWFVFMSNFGF